MSCVFDAGAGAGTIPKEMFAVLGPSDGTVSSPGSFFVEPQSIRTITTSDATFQLIVQGTQISAEFKSAP